MADFDNDGRVDLFVANANGMPFLYHNVAPVARAGSADGPHWASFILQGTKSNRSAIGAQLRITSGGRTALRFVDGGNSFAGQSSARVQVGLGSSTRIDRLEVRWPSGARQEFKDLPVDRITHIVEGETPAAFSGRVNAQ